jgi:hypothetical protein
LSDDKIRSPSCSWEPESEVVAAQASDDAQDPQPQDSDAAAESSLPVEEEEKDPVDALSQLRYLHVEIKAAVEKWECALELTQADCKGLHRFFGLQCSGDKMGLTAAKQLLTSLAEFQSQVVESWQELQRHQEFQNESGNRKLITPRNSLGAPRKSIGGGRKSLASSDIRSSMTATGRPSISRKIRSPDTGRTDSEEEADVNAEQNIEEKGRLTEAAKAEGSSPSLVRNGSTESMRQKMEARKAKLEEQTRLDTSD